MDPNQPSTERRRSERVPDSLPLIVRGIDLLGQPFEERTTTLALNLHGCRYASKHHLPKNTWVTLELPQSPGRHNVRARVAWIQRPHSVRELFQIAVELESAANLWGLSAPPPNWELRAPSLQSTPGSAGEGELRAAAGSEKSALPSTLANFMDELMTDMISGSPGSPEAESPAPFVFTPATDSPLLRELRAELERQALKAVESAAAQAKEKLGAVAQEIEERRASAAAEDLRNWKEEFDQTQQRARALIAELDRAAQEARRTETELAQEAGSRMAQARLQMEGVEAAEAALAARQATDLSKEAAAATEANAAKWRERLESEMALAQAQWNELLQSSLDGGMQRMVTQLSERSQEVLRNSELKMTERFAELRQPLLNLSLESREKVAGIKAALELEVAQARTSLADIEQSAARMKEFSTQFEAASHDTLNQLHRRLENVIEAPTVELNRRMENVVAGLAQRVTPALDALESQFVERSVAEVESKLTPHFVRVPELVRELAAREAQAEEGLRLHRERLRQVAENSQREVAANMAATLAELRNNFEAARKEALTKWNEELDAGGVRASHAAGEAIGRSSEWFQQEARARMQVLVEQSLSNAGTRLVETAAETARKFVSQLEAQFASRIAEIDQQILSAAGEVVGRTRTRLEEAAEAAAASFGQVVRGISDREVEHCTGVSRAALQERSQEFERSAAQLLQGLEAKSITSLNAFQVQMASQLESSIADGRGALAAESASAIEKYEDECHAREGAWLTRLDRLNIDAAGKYQERLDTMCDSWMVSSVRRLNEHGQNVVESLMRSADQSLRESFSRVFVGLAEMLRERGVNAAGVAGFAPPPTRDAAEPPAPRNEAASNQSSA